MKPGLLYREVLVYCMLKLVLNSCFLEIISILESAVVLFFCLLS